MTSPSQPPVQNPALAQALNRSGFAFARAAGLTGSANVLVSPLSVHQLLGMIANGAEGEALAAARKLLGDEQLKLETMNGLYESWNAGYASPESPLQVGNGLWVLRNVTPTKSALDVLRTSYRAEYRQVDSPAAALPQINGWVNEKTKGMIPTLFDQLDPNAAIVLVNALAFEGKWSLPFASEETREQVWRGPTGGKAMMMSRKMPRGLYGETDLAQAVRLPYKGNQFAMTLVLPKPGVAIDRLATHEAFSALTSALRGREGFVSIPRWKSTHTVDLMAVWREMGGGAVLAGGAFGRFAPELAGVPIGQAVQKTFIEVDEQGTKAAAASGAVGVTSMPVDGPFEFVADRPFLYTIDDLRTGGIVFLGVLNQPS